MVPKAACFSGASRGIVSWIKIQNKPLSYVDRDFLLPIRVSLKLNIRKPFPFLQSCLRNIPSPQRIFDFLVVWLYSLLWCKPDVFYSLVPVYNEDWPSGNLVAWQVDKIIVLHSIVLYCFLLIIAQKGKVQPVSFCEDLECKRCIYANTYKLAKPREVGEGISECAHLLRADRSERSREESQNHFSVGCEFLQRPKLPILVVKRKLRSFITYFQSHATPF